MNSNETPVLLGYEQLGIIRSRFIGLFNNFTASLVSEADINEFGTHIGKMKANFQLFKIAHPDQVSVFNEEIFNREFIRDMYFELLERLSLEMVSLGKDCFRRFIETIATASEECKAMPGEREDGLEPILTIINIDKEWIVDTYQNNPWLLIVVLINMEFENTTAGQEITQTLRRSARG